jgi:hypothetical protein
MKPGPTVLERCFFGIGQEAVSLRTRTPAAEAREILVMNLLRSQAGSALSCLLLCAGRRVRYCRP